MNDNELQKVNRKILEGDSPLLNKKEKVEHLEFLQKNSLAALSNKRVNLHYNAPKKAKKTLFSLQALRFDLGLH